MSNKYLDEESRQEQEKENIRNELQNRYQPDWNECEEVFTPMNTIKEYLGETDADIEWNINAKAAYDTFLNIAAYETFKENDSIILVGRTGTGKSSILNRYKYAVEHGEILGFNLVVEIKFQRFFDKLKLYDFEENSNAVHYIKDVLRIIIQLAVMQKVVKSFDSNTDGLDCLKETLELVCIFDDTNIIERFCDDLDEKFDPSDKLRKAMLLIKKSYDNIVKDHSVESLNRVLDGRRVVVLADSLDYYDITEKRIIILNRALIELAFEYFQQLKDKRFLLKVAVPSEVYKHILEGIVAKKKAKTVTIEWRYKDLIKMLAIKTFYCFKVKNYSFAKEFIEEYNLEDFYDFDIAYKFLSNMLPQNCHASIPMCFDTISYCIRHTQKKPRQIIKIFNSFIERICEEKQFSFFIYNDKLIPKYIHRVQYDIIDDALSMYNAYAKQEVLPIVSNALRKKRNFMSLKDLNDAAKDAAKIYSVLGLSPDDIKNILIESGLVGVVYKEHFIKENSELFQNKVVNKISIAVFEYQRKDKLTHRSGFVYILHPMCYEYYVNEIDYNALVYPAPANDLGDNIINKLMEQNIIY